jgi:hypothetical protein
MKKWVAQRRTWYILFTVLTVIATFQAFHPSTFGDTEIVYTDYNNYLIFKQSFQHLISDQNLYVGYPTEYYDLYKYTPTFAAIFGALAWMPDSIGLFLWNLLNALIIVWAIFGLPKLPNHYKGIALLLLTVEMMTSIQNEQSNGLITGFIIGAFVLLEKRQFVWATLLIVLTIYIKLFGVVACLLFLFYPQKIRIAILTLSWMVVLFLIPLLFVQWDQYIVLWQEYLHLLEADHSNSFGYSVMGIMSTWFDLSINKIAVVASGGLMLLSVFLRYRLYENSRYRQNGLVAILIWIVIFNHKAESPTFIIAMAGMALWYVWSKKQKWHLFVMIGALVFTSLSATDLFPPAVRNGWVKPYAIKAVPAILVWSILFLQIWSMKVELPYKFEKERKDSLDKVNQSDSVEI